VEMFSSNLYKERVATIKNREPKNMYQYFFLYICAWSSITDPVIAPPNTTSSSTTTTTTATRPEETTETEKNFPIVSFPENTFTSKRKDTEDNSAKGRYIITSSSSLYMLLLFV
jgi:hypothetical protein